MRGRLKFAFNNVKSAFKGRFGSLESPYALVAATASLGVGGYVINDYIDKAEMNRSFPSYHEIAQFQLQLQHKFAKESSHVGTHQHVFNALLEAIVLGDLRLAEMELTELKEIDALTTGLCDDLIVFASNHSKINILQLFVRQFGADRVIRNDHARQLLSLSPNEQSDVTATLEAFYQGPGQIRPYQMAKYVLATNKALPQQIIDGIAYQPENVVGDLAEDIVSGYRQVVMVARVLGNLDDKIKYSQVLCTDMYPDYIARIEEYYRSLMQAACATNMPVVGTLVLAGGHYTILQIKVEQTASGKSNATVLHIDPLGMRLSMLGTGFFDIVSIPHRVFDDVKLQFSEELNQVVVPGCSHFVCSHYRDLLSLDVIMGKNTQYQFAGKDNVIFDYADHHTTRMIPYGYGYHHEDGTYDGCAEAGQFVLPAFMLVSKQTLERTGEIEDSFDEFDQLPNGRYAAKYDQRNQKLIMLGAMGINKERQASPPERQAEFSKPADVRGEQSVDAVVASGVKSSNHGGRVRPQNKRNDFIGYNFGFFMSRNLEVVLKEDVKQVSSNISKLD